MLFKSYLNLFQGALTHFAYSRYKDGSGFTEETGDEYKGGYPTPQGGYQNNDSKQYASFPRHSEGDDFTRNTYQPQPFSEPQPPFGVPPQEPVKTEYDVPNY